MQSFDILGIGNAIVDVLSYVEEEFLRVQDIPKGGMVLIDEAKAATIYDMLGQTEECSGGSVANSLAGIASLGGSCAYIGKVRDDELGTIFRHDMLSIGVHFTTAASTEGPATARCLVCVTPDAERSMATYIGACAEVSEADIEETLIANSAITYVEGYLWDQPSAKQAIEKALEYTKKHGKKAALTLSDPFCVNRHRQDFLQLIEQSVDILFANEEEILSLFETSDLTRAISMIQAMCPLTVVTQSEKGCTVITEKQHFPVAADTIGAVKDTTGAGDLFAAGFLYGLSKGADLMDAAKLGNKCAGHIIQQLGARSATPLTELAA